jgi:hypothetical protein
MASFFLDWRNCTIICGCVDYGMEVGMPDHGKFAILATTATK